MEVLLKPMTVNQCWQGRRFKTKNYLNWRLDFSDRIKKGTRIKGNMAVILEFYIKHDKTTDVDNLIKPVFDALKESGVIEDDRFIKEVHAYKYNSDKEFIRITIENI